MSQLNYQELLDLLKKKKECSDNSSIAFAQSAMEEYFYSIKKA